MYIRLSKHMYCETTKIYPHSLVRGAYLVAQAQVGEKRSAIEVARELSTGAIVQSTASGEKLYYTYHIEVRVRLCFRHEWPHA